MPPFFMQVPPPFLQIEIFPRSHAFVLTDSISLNSPCTGNIAHFVVRPLPTTRGVVGALLPTRRRLIALVDCGCGVLPPSLLGLHGQYLELYLLGLGGLLLFPLQPLFQVFLGGPGPGVVQLLHLAPKQDQRLRAAGIAECPRLQVHPGLLPHGLPVGSQRGGGVTAEQELVVPVELPILVLLQEVVPADLLKDRVPLVVLVADGPGLVRVRQPELEHQLEQLGVCRLLHGPLALQASRRLGGRKLLGLSA
ncbi:Integral membrane protein, partial [Dysosmobacter welbionis]